MSEQQAQTEHTPVRVLSNDGISFVHCSCRDDVHPQSAIWLREHWTGTEDDGVEALRAVVQLQAELVKADLEVLVIKNVRYDEPGDCWVCGADLEDVVGAQVVTVGAVATLTEVCSLQCARDVVERKAQR